MNASSQCGRIFLLSHMRAYTSLAGHILGTHPKINGYHEMHLSYDEPAALDRQLITFLENDALKPGSRYLFDKLLHNDYVFQPERLGLTDIKILVSLRTPEQTIPSIVHLFAGKQIDDPYASPVEAANYYIARIRALADFCRATRQPYYYYDAELFQSVPEALLSRLTNWLELDSPLSGDYQIFSQTGQARRGDSSPRIRSGCIDLTSTDYSHVQVPAALLNKAREAYQACRQQIIDKAADSLQI